MTWDYIFMLALGAYAFKSSGLIILNKFNLDRFFQNSVLLIPIALLAALITEQTFVIDQAIDLDERVIGLLIALVLIKKKGTLNYHWMCFPADKNILSFFGKDTVVKEIYSITK